MQFLLMLYADEKAGVQIPPGRMAKVMEAMGAYKDALAKANAFVMTAPLARSGEARTMRMEGGTASFDDASGTFVTEGGELKVHDGPYADTREQFGGLYIIEARDMDEALAWAARCPAAQWGSIEVRAMIPGY